jgi:hypothetical protein
MVNEQQSAASNIYEHQFAVSNGREREPSIAIFMSSKQWLSYWKVERGREHSKQRSRESETTFQFQPLMPPLVAAAVA